MSFGPGPIGLNVRFFIQDFNTPTALGPVLVMIGSDRFAKCAPLGVIGGNSLN